MKLFKTPWNAIAIPPAPAVAAAAMLHAAMLRPSVRNWHHTIGMLKSGVHVVEYTHWGRWGPFSTFRPGVLCAFSLQSDTTAKVVYQDPGAVGRNAHRWSYGLPPTPTGGPIKTALVTAPAGWLFKIHKSKWGRDLRPVLISKRHGVTVDVDGDIATGAGRRRLRAKCRRAVEVERSHQRSIRRREALRRRTIAQGVEQLKMAKLSSVDVKHLRIPAYAAKFWHIGNTPSATDRVVAAITEKPTTAAAAKRHAAACLLAEKVAAFPVTPSGKIFWTGRHAVERRDRDIQIAEARRVEMEGYRAEAVEIVKRSIEGDRDLPIVHVTQSDADTAGLCDRGVDDFVQQYRITIEKDMFRRKYTSAADVLRVVRKLHRYRVRHGHDRTWEDRNDRILAARVLEVAVTRSIVESAEYKTAA